VANHLGRFLFARGAYVQAEPLFAQAQAIFEKARGPDRHQLATVLNDLAEL
jgi:tetratricopeptide repeat protein